VSPDALTDVLGAPVSISDMAHVGRAEPMAPASRSRWPGVPRRRIAFPTGGGPFDSWYGYPRIPAVVQPATVAVLRLLAPTLDPGARGVIEPCTGLHSRAAGESAWFD
jgi:hypothetical protein